MLTTSVMTGMPAGPRRSNRDFCLHPLKAERGGTGLESAAAQNGGTGLFNDFGGLHELFFIFYSTRPGDNDNARAADFHAAAAHHGIFRFKSAGCQFIRFHDARYAFHARKHRKNIGGDLAGVASQ